jgi:hypothetical protein
VFQLYLAILQTFQNLDLLKLFGGQQNKAPAPVVMFTLVSLYVPRELDLGRNEHRFFALAQIEHERTIWSSLSHSTFDSGLGTCWQMEPQFCAEVLVNNEGLLLLAH